MATNEHIQIEADYMDDIYERRRLECIAHVGFAAPLLAEAAREIAIKYGIPDYDLELALDAAAGLIHKRSREE